MKLNMTVGQIASVLTIISLLTAGGFFVHGYFAKTAELVSLKAELTTYKLEQERTVLRLQRELKLESWTTEQTFIVIRGDTILDRIAIVEEKEQTDRRDRQLDRWQKQLEDQAARKREIKSSQEDLRLLMLTP